MRFTKVFVLTLCACAVLAATSGETQAQSVTFSVGTDTGNDSIQSGTEGAIIFHVEAVGAELSGIQIALRFSYTNGNIIGAIKDPLNFSFSPAASVMEIQAYNNTYGNGTNPDSITFLAADITPPGWTGGAEFARVTFTPTDSGTIYIDSTTIAGASLVAVDGFGMELPIVWVPDTIFVAPPRANGDVNCDGVISAADIVYMVNHVFKSGPTPCE